MNIGEALVRSWRQTEGIFSTEEVLRWVDRLNSTVRVDIQKTTLANTKWFYENASGSIVNKDRSFFQVVGLRQSNIEQPIFIQNEIGYLGVLCKPIQGVLHFLMQAKIEPGNVNKIQLSPTLQATKSNFTQAHGGAKPAYLDWFLGASSRHIIVDQIQSEQSSRFISKRNRNTVILLDENDDIEESPHYRWLTLGQIKRLMRRNNLVNMDTRTVLSCIPFDKSSFRSTETPLERSITNGLQHGILPRIFNYINNYKMFSSVKFERVPLRSLTGWKTNKYDTYEEFVCEGKHPFKLIYCDISIEGREVRHWGQPLFEAQGMATFGLLTRTNNGATEFLVHAKPEVGCFDGIELGPTIQLEATEEPSGEIERLFFEKYLRKDDVLHDVVLSEEGGRFFHEQNKNIIVEIEATQISTPPPGYFWCTYRTLNDLVQINNILNIQLRNLLALLEVAQ